MAFSASTLEAETRDLLALHLVPGLGPRLTKALLARFGSATGVLAATAHELRTVPHIGEKTAADLAAAFRTADVEKELELIERHQVHLVRLGTAEYPGPLSNIPDPPQLLYLRGSLTEADRTAVAVVGSRSCTSYGRRIATRLAEGLARAGFTVVSGLARGIDREAHCGALSAGGRTIAVLAGGLSRIYPPEHADLAEEIVASGALLSESPMSMEPLAGMFPARNRLISGLCRGVVVVEAAEKSGALISARHAAEQGREVFAVPGPVDSAASGGTLKLLRSGATLVRDAADILEAFGTAAVPRAVSRPAPAAVPQVPLSPTQQQIWDSLSHEPTPADLLVQRTNLPVAEVGAILLTLEMRGLVRRLPGNRYERV